METSRQRRFVTRSSKRRTLHQFTELDPLAVSFVAIGNGTARPQSGAGVQLCHQRQLINQKRTTIVCLQVSPSYEVEGDPRRKRVFECHSADSKLLCSLVLAGFQKVQSSLCRVLSHTRQTDRDVFLSFIPVALSNVYFGYYKLDVLIIHSPLDLTPLSQLQLWKTDSQKRRRITHANPSPNRPDPAGISFRCEFSCREI